MPCTRDAFSVVSVLNAAPSLLRITIVIIFLFSLHTFLGQSTGHLVSRV